MHTLSLICALVLCSPQDDAVEKLNKELDRVEAERDRARAEAVRLGDALRQQQWELTYLRDTIEIHDRIDTFVNDRLNQIREFLSPEDCAEWARLRTTRRVRARRITVVMEAGTLGELMKQVSEKAGVRIALEPELGESRDLDKEITFKVKELLLKHVLQLALSQWDLKYVIRRDGTILVTTPDFTPKDEKKLEARARRKDRETLDYLFSVGPAQPAQAKKVEARVRALHSDRLNEREDAAEALLDMGFPARNHLESLDLTDAPAEVRARVKVLRKKLNSWHGPVIGAGLHHDVVFLSFLNDARAYERLKRILGTVHGRFPEMRKGWAFYLRGWWAYSRDGLKWNDKLDRFEKKE